MENTLFGFDSSSFVNAQPAIQGELKKGVWSGTFYKLTKNNFKQT